jgi:hypothetical protein
MSDDDRIDIKDFIRDLTPEEREKLAERQQHFVDKHRETFDPLLKALADCVNTGDRFQLVFLVESCAAILTHAAILSKGESPRTIAGWPVDGAVH